MNESESLDVPTEERCSFCDYLDGVRQYTILCRNEFVATLVTREQRGVGHLLVIPVRHYPTLLEANQAELHAIIDTVARAASAIDAVYGRPGIAVWQNNGAAAHQAIPHLHFHVAGTLPGGGTNFDEVPELSVAETNAIAERIRAGAPSPVCEAPSGAALANIHRAKQ